MGTKTDLEILYSERWGHLSRIEFKKIVALSHNGYDILLAVNSLLEEQEINDLGILARAKNH